MFTSTYLEGFKLKVIHLVTSLVGGAATAALRLNLALVEAGHDSKVLTVTRRVNHTEIDKIQIQEIGKFQRNLSSAVTFLQSRILQKKSDPVSPISLDLLNWNDKQIQSADVIHLHAFYNLVSIRNFLEKYPNKIKVVTLHDERFYTGGCHQSNGCNAARSGCLHCPQVNKVFRPLVKGTKRALTNKAESVQNILFICPSDWIMSRARQALPEISPDRFIKIYNPIPEPIRKEKGMIKNDGRISIGFISQDLDNPIKNLALLRNAYTKISAMHPSSYKLKLYGNSINDYSSKQLFIEQDSFNSNDALEAVMAEIDVLVVPSTHDNLPNVLGEALMNGVGVIASDVGGIPELLNRFSQKTFESGNESSLISAILDFNFPNPDNLKKLAKSILGYKAISQSLIIAYTEEATRIERTNHPT